jgi:hypothetical protein
VLSHAIIIRESSASPPSARKPKKARTVRG